MNKDISPLQTQRDIREVNMRVDAFINEVYSHIEKTKREVQRRKKRCNLDWKGVMEREYGCE